MSLVHQINVPNITRTVGTLKSKTVFNEFDEFGLLTGLPRISGETNWEYKRRIQSVFVKRANSSYRGLINGITRELGLELFQPILINPKVDGSGQFLASDPYIEFNGIYLNLYSDYKNGLLDYQIDRNILGGNYEHLGRLVDKVNTTFFFDAELLSESNRFTRSMTLLNQSNRVRSGSEDIPSTELVKLAHQHIVQGSITFSSPVLDSNSRMIEVDSVVALTNEKHFYVNYKDGTIQLYQAPGMVTYVKYKYVEYPFKPTASPVILSDINNDAFKVAMFKQILQDDGTYAHGLPTELGVDIINELISVYPLYWGI